MLFRSTIKTGVASVSDPLLYLKAPAVGGCGRNNYVVSSGTVTLSPGVYCGGLTIKGSANVTLSAGTYILNGGGMNVSGSAHVTGTGVTLYNTRDSTHPYGPITSQDTPVITLSAPTSGSLAGILIFQDRSVVSATPNIIVGTLTGALYFPTTPIVLSSQQNVATPYSIIVAKTLSLNVNTLTVSSNYSSLSEGSPIKVVTLTE